MKLKYTIAAMAATTMAANAAITIASYDANTGSPANAAAIVGPESVAGGSWGVTDTTLVAADVQEGVIEGGQAAWRNMDGTGNNNPGYTQAMTITGYQQMFDNGFTLTWRMRLGDGGTDFSGASSSGAFGYVGGDNTNTVGGYAFAGDRRIGASIGESAVGEYTVTPQGIGTVAVTGISMATYVRIEFIGDAGAQTGTFNLYNDDTNALLSSQAFTAWANANTSTDAHTGFMSGSSGGDNREQFTREFNLSAVPEPSSAALLGLGGLALILRRRK